VPSPSVSVRLERRADSTSPHRQARQSASADAEQDERRGPGACLFQDDIESRGSDASSQIRGATVDMRNVLRR